MLKRLRPLLLIALLGLVVAAHIGLWADESIPVEAKRRLTVLNALAWAVIVLPAIGVRYWLKAHQRHNRDRNR